MNITPLREAQAKFEPQLINVIEEREKLHEKRRRFIKYFTPVRIENMPIKEYVLGLEQEKGSPNFCYGMERDLDGLGRILGATAIKFGVYFGVVKSDPVPKFRFAKRFGSDEIEAYRNVQKAIIDLISFGKVGDTNSIIKNSLSPMLKGKILATYYPEIYLNVFSENHLNFFITQLNLDLNDPLLLKSDDTIKRQALVDFKNRDEIMSKWPPDIFSYFLYNYYLGHPPKDEEQANGPLADYQMPVFPPDQIPLKIDLTILPPVTNDSQKNKSSISNPDYEAEARRQKLIGNRGEEIVLKFERQRLQSETNKNLALLVKPAKYDSDGYDIYSVELDETPRYIEVKATRAKAGKVNFFLSANELKKAMELDNYHIYIVFEILNSHPKIWILGNPFKSKNDMVSKVPILYKVSINAE